MQQCQWLTIWSGCPPHAKEKTGRGDPRLTIFVRGPTDVDPKVGDPRLTQRGPRVDLRPLRGLFLEQSSNGLRHVRGDTSAQPDTEGGVCGYAIKDSDLIVEGDG